MSGDFSVLFQKKHLNMFNIDEMAARIEKIASCPGVIAYEPLRITPTTVAISPFPPAKQLHDLSGLTPLVRPLPEAEAVRVVERLLRAVLALHQRRVVHGHLSLESIREDARGSVVIVDAAVPLTVLARQSPAYTRLAPLLAPETRMTHSSPSLTPAVDVWGVAIVMLQLTAPERYCHFDTDDVVGADLLCPHFAALGPRSISMLVRCLKEDPALRPTIEELLCDIAYQNATAASMGAKRGADEGAMSSEAVIRARQLQGGALNGDDSDEDSDDEDEEEEEEDEEEGSDEESSSDDSEAS